LRSRRLKLAGEYLLTALALVWRRLMFRTTFIAITGSVGKSTATQCLGAMLASRHPTNYSRAGGNSRGTLARIILRTRPWHRFTVTEVGTRAPGALRRAAWTIAPDVVLMLRVLKVHSDAFPSIEAMAAEKAQLLSRLGRRGMAILNADDERVMAMGESLRGRIHTFGLFTEADVTASDVSSRWPDPLSFRAQFRGQSAVAQTNLHGEHFVYSALGALATAVHCGVPLEQAVAQLALVEPIPGRMQPVPLPNGATAICDTYNSALPMLQAAMNFLSQARAGRKIAVVHDVFDSGLTSRPRARDLARRVAAAADICVFIGGDAGCAAREAVKAGVARSVQAHAFKTADEAVTFLRGELRQGDLLLVQGGDRRHLERITIAQLGEVGCRRPSCRRHFQCSACPDLNFVPFPVPAASALVTVQSGSLNPR